MFYLRLFSFSMYVYPDIVETKFKYKHIFQYKYSRTVINGYTYIPAHVVSGVCDNSPRSHLRSPIFSPYY